ncbi:hypothetical protein J2787_003071 [Chryseobacterium rhizosphaerae]|uniref:Pectate lyase superfamily protein domain-containing protein n=1 Tax=Chryseobacterium rhizosphaerae TaxID=395937 RepID=A0AAE3Y9X0_9FLAO|nr:MULTISPECIES: hypothetical protein [Chryseobacterium]MBL3547351.1 hypothetical protein [Chryseobacterium sp. KMC2]MDR6527679.1 hypothetical protein [Chryseobacterium rhizosphaerae]
MKLLFRNIINIVTVFVFVYCNAQNTKSLNQFGAKGDGITDDSEMIKKAMLESQNGIILDGQNRTYLIAKNIDLDLKSLNLINTKIITGKEYIRQSIKINSNNIVLDNISVDGGRNSYKKGYEIWNVFSKENNVESIYPDEPDFFYFTGLDKKANYSISNLSMNNMHASSAITIITYGNVNFKNINFNNLSNKSFHIYHSVDEGKYQSGSTYVINAIANNVGVLSDKVMVNKTVYNRDDLKVMPQASFNFIVSFGNFYFDKLVVNNYGSSGVTSDRNLNFIGDQIIVSNDSDKVFSNNPSGAVWFEDSKNIYVKNISVNIQKRNSKDLQFDSSAVSLFAIDSSVKIDNITIKGNNNKILNKAIKGSFAGKNNVFFGNITIDGNYKQAGALFATVENVPLESKININKITYKNQTIEFYGMKDVHINEVFGITGKEKLNFKLSKPIRDENYTIKNINLNEINVGENVKKVNVTNNSHKIKFSKLY